MATTYITSRASLLYKLVSEIPVARRMDRERCSWEELFAYASRFADGVLCPVQREVEICRFLGEVEKIRPRYVMELGTAHGGTFFMLARAAAPDAFLISLDLPGGAGGGGYSQWKTSVFRRIILPGQKASFVRQDSHSPETLAKVRDLLRGNPLDFLFIDGDHSYEGVKQDFETYSQLVRPGGIIGFHDIVPSQMAEVGNDVSRYWNDLRQTRDHQEFVENWGQNAMGIGMLRAV